MSRTAVSPDRATELAAEARTRIEQADRGRSSKRRQDRAVKNVLEGIPDAKVVDEEERDE